MAADVTMNRKIVVLTWKAPFNQMGLLSFGIHPRKKCPQALLRAFASKRYEASEWMFMIMSDAWKQTLASACPARYGASLGETLCFINNLTLRLKIEEFSLWARSEHLKSQPNHPKRMAGFKNECIFVFCIRRNCL
jgi:hypothetical protein